MTLLPDEDHGIADETTRPPKPVEDLLAATVVSSYRTAIISALLFLLFWQVSSGIACNFPTPIDCLSGLAW